MKKLYIADEDADENQNNNNNNDNVVRTMQMYFSLFENIKKIMTMMMISHRQTQFKNLRSQILHSL